MALNVDEIAEILNTMRIENEHNVENFEKVLTGINNKLEMMSEDNEETDLIKVYISELKNSVENKYSTTVQKFDNLEELFKNIISSNNTLAKTSELRDFFQVINANFNAFSSESENNKNALKNIDDKINKLGESIPDKEEIPSLINELSLDFSDLSSNIEKTYENIENSLSQAIEDIRKIDFSDSINSLSDQIRELSSNVDAVPSRISFGALEDKMSSFNTVMEALRKEFAETSLQNKDLISDNFKKLESEFESIVTESDFSGFKSDLADFVQKIIDNSAALNSELSYSTERIENILSTVKALDFRDDFENIIIRINDIKETFEDGSKISYSNLSSEITALSDKISNSFNNLDTGRQEIYSDLKNELSSILSNLQKVLEINPQKFVDELSQNLMALRSGIGSDIEADYGDLKASLASVISSLQSVKDEIIEKYSSDSSYTNNTLNGVLERINVQTSKLVDLEKILSENSKADTADIKETLDKVYNDISAVIANINDNSNSNYEATKEYIEELTSSVNSLREDFNEKSEQNADKIIFGLNTVSSDVTLLRDELRQTVSANLENSSKILDNVSALSTKISEVENSLTGSAKLNFETLKSLLDSLSEKLSEDMEKQSDLFSQTNAVGTVQKLEAIQNLSNDIKNLESVFNANNEVFKSAVKEDISTLKDYLNEINASIDKSRTDTENKLISKLDALDVLNHAFETSVASISAEIQNVYNTVNSLDLSEYSDEIKEETEKLNFSLGAVLTAINSVNSQNNEFAVAINELKADCPSKFDVTSLSDKLDKYHDAFSEIRDVVNASAEDLSEKYGSIFENIENSFSKVVSQSDFSLFKADFTDFIRKILDNSTILNSDSAINREKIVEISEKLTAIESVDYSYNLEELASKIDELYELFDNKSQSTIDAINVKLDEVKDFISDNDKSSLVIEKINEYSEILSSLKDFISVLDNENTSLLKDFSSQIEVKLQKIASVDDFTNLKTDFDEFIQKILDNINILHVNSEAGKEQISQILERLNTINYSDTLEKVDGSINEIKEVFENNSKMNYENIVNTINDLKNEINSVINSCDAKNSTSLEKLGSDLSDVSVNISFLRDLAIQKTSDILDNITNELNQTAEKVESSINANSKLNFDDVKISLAGILNEIVGIKDDFSQKNDANVFNISTGFDKVKSSLENILDAVNSIGENFKDKGLESSQNIIENIHELSLNIDELKSELQNLSNEYLTQVNAAIHDISDKVDGLSEEFAGEVKEDISSLKSLFVSLSNEIQTSKDDFENLITENDSKNVQDFKNCLFNTNNDLKLYIEEISASLKEYISELDVAANSSLIQTDNKLSGKLLELEASLVHSSEDYENKLVLLNEKLSEFVHIVENSNSDTEAKIASSLDEITDVKGELSLISDALKSVKLAADEKFTETISVLDTGLETLINKIAGLNEPLINGVESTVKETISALEDRFSSIISLITELKESGYSDTANFLAGLEEKISGLKEEIGLINTDITDAFASKSEEIIRAFEPVKISLEEFSSFDYEKIISEIKAQLEKSFMDFSVDVNTEFVSASDSISRLEQAYKETFNKISTIEDFVSEKIEADIELLKVNIEQNTRDVKTIFDEKFEECIDDLKTYLDVALHNAKDFEKINDISDKLNSVLAVQESIQENTNVISANIGSLGDELKNYVQSACENTIDKYSPADTREVLDTLNQKIDVIVASDNHEAIVDAIDELHEKLDILSSNENKEILKAISEYNQKAQSNNEIINDSFAEINSKLDIIATEPTLDVLTSKIDGISEQTEESTGTIKNIVNDAGAKVTEMLASLHEKVDILAMDENGLNLEDEIEDIKDLIFEQRKYFEAASDEKAAAIDKYLRDLLLKLDNVDLEKNAEDIKESIMNALVSLVDQISFVEETEEIKDFVEEKTDEINQNLIEVQNQLKQIASSSDDFGYSYTLQDVESDIAKLRLAINNMSGNDFESFSDDIKKIVSSVEGLESTLTQEQIVDLKGDIEKLNDDILSISSRTNKLLLTSDESYKALNDGLNNFSNIIYKLEDRISSLDKSDISENLERKIDSIHSMAVASANADKVFHQVMMYLGEWIDSTTENISSITDKTAEIVKIKENINELRSAIPEKSALLDELEDKFEKQEERIDRLEMKLDKILSTLEEKDDMMLNRKVDKIEKLISRLGNNIEKLTSYVDEE